jgi:hypothetical protein
MEYTIPNNINTPEPPPAPKKGYCQYYSASDKKWVFVKK